MFHTAKSALSRDSIAGFMNRPSLGAARFRARPFFRAPARSVPPEVVGDFSRSSSTTLVCK